MATQYSVTLASSSSQYLTGGNYLDNQSNFSVAFWVKNSGTADTQMWLTKIQSTSGNYAGWFIAYISDTFYFDIQEGTGKYIENAATITVSDGAWHHIVCTRNGTTLKIYIDGIDRTGTLYSAGTVTTISNSLNVIVGQNSGITASQYANAKFDDVRMWSRTLSAADVLSLYQGPSSFSNGSSFEAWWKLDNDYTDSSGNSRTLSATNTPVFSTDTPYSTVARDSNVQDQGGSSVNTLAWNHTTSGNNRFLFVCLLRGISGDPTAVTYNGVTMTKLTATNSGTGVYTWVYGLYAPAQGTYQVSTSWSSSAITTGSSMSYNGVAQKLPLVLNTNANTGTNTIAVSATTVRSDSWCFGFFRNEHICITSMTGGAVIYPSSSVFTNIVDTNGPVATGSRTFTATYSGSNSAKQAHILALEPALAMTDGQTSYWKLENENDTINGWAMTNNGSTPFNAGRIGNAADGGSSNTTKYLSRVVDALSGSMGIDGSTSHTVSFWLNVTTQISSGGWAYPIYIENSHNTANDMDNGYFQLDYSGGVLGYYYLCGAGWVKNTKTFTPGNWYHVAWVANKEDNKFKIFVNGVEEGTTRTFASGASGTNRTPRSGFLASAYDGSGKFSGLVDECGVWNRALTEGEITFLYNNGAGKQYPYVDRIFVSPGTGKMNQAIGRASFF